MCVAADGIWRKGGGLETNWVTAEREAYLIFYPSVQSAFGATWHGGKMRETWMEREREREEGHTSNRRGAKKCAASVLYMYW